jgi:hypothetical protein
VTGYALLLDHDEDEGGGGQLAVLDPEALWSAA